MQEKRTVETGFRGELSGSSGPMAAGNKRALMTRTGFIIAQI